MRNSPGNEKARNAAADKAIKSLDRWLHESVAKGLWEKHIWTYEYERIAQATKRVRTLLKSVKEPDAKSE